MSQVGRMTSWRRIRLLGLALFAALALSIGSAITSAGAYEGGDWPAYEPEMSYSESCFLAKWNDYREDEGLEPVSVTDDLNREADGRAKYLYEKDYARSSGGGHELLDNSGLIQREDDMAEILLGRYGITSKKSVEKALTGWQNSPGHNRWLLGKKVPLDEPLQSISTTYAAAGVAEIMPEEYDQAVWVVVFYAPYDDGQNGEAEHYSSHNRPSMSIGSDLGQGNSTDCGKSEMRSTNDYSADGHSTEGDPGEHAVQLIVNKRTPNFSWQPVRRGRGVSFRLRNAPLLNRQVATIRMRRQVLRCRWRARGGRHFRRCHWRNRGGVRVMRQELQDANRPLRMRFRGRRRRTVLFASSPEFQVGSTLVNPARAMVVCSRRCRIR